METKSRPECKFKPGDQVKYRSPYYYTDKFCTVTRVEWTVFSISGVNGFWKIWGHWYFEGKKPNAREGYCEESVVQLVEPAHPDYEKEGDWI